VTSGGDILDGGVLLFLAAEGWIDDFLGGGAFLGTLASSDALPFAPPFPLPPSALLADPEASAAFFSSSFRWWNIFLLLAIVPPAMAPLLDGRHCNH
jgi:hypothetical protein